MATFLFVAGAWLGGWCWRDVAAALRADGHTVSCATLTGLGERAHLVNREVGLGLHVADVLCLLQHEDLSDVVLVGHSYGGTVITAVAEQASHRIRRLVYLDASVPLDDQTNNDVIGPEIAGALRSAADSGDGWLVPALRPWLPSGWRRRCGRGSPSGSRRIRCAASRSRCGSARARPLQCRDPSCAPRYSRRSMPA
jgi:pimeloyl-ACP methyl ester carboxylesterase